MAVSAGKRIGIDVDVDSTINNPVEFASQQPIWHLPEEISGGVVRAKLHPSRRE